MSFLRTNVSNKPATVKGYTCSNPRCGRLFTERGLFQHFDKSPPCRQYYSSLSTSPKVPIRKPNDSAPTVVRLPSSLSHAAQNGEKGGNENNSVHEDNLSLPSDGEDDVEMEEPVTLDSSNSNKYPADTRYATAPDIRESSLSQNNGISTPDTDEDTNKDSEDDDSDIDDDDAVVVLEIAENLPVDLLEPDDPDENDDDEDQESIGTSNHSDDEDKSSNQGSACDSSDEDEFGNDDSDSETQHEEEPNPSSAYFVDSNSAADMPPKTFQYTDHKDGLYTPRKWIQEWIDWSRKTYERQAREQKDQNVLVLPDDLSLLILLLNDPNYQHGWYFISDAERAEIHLMNKLNSIKGCPLYVYDAVIDWAKVSLSIPVSMEFDSPLPLMRCRENFLKTSPEFAHTTNMKPRTTNITLPGCGRRVSLTTMSYSANLYHFLTNRETVNDDCLLIPGDTPHDNPPVAVPSSFDDLNTGSRYLTSWEAMKKEDIDFPLGDIFFVDKSHLDVNGRLCAEPVNHTFSIVKRKVRYTPEAWYSIGCVPNQRGLNYTSGSVAKIQDYHFILNDIFQEYRELQQKYKGILWPLLFKGTLYMIRLRPYVFACLGDTPGQNYMCGNMGSSKCNRICRYCDIEKKFLSHPWKSYTLMTKERFQEIQNDPALLFEFSYKPVRLFWDKLNFGVPYESIHNNVPGELLHAFQKGLLVYVIEVLLSTQCTSAASQKDDLERVERIENKQKGALREEIVSDLIKAGAFGGIWTQYVDNLSRALGVMLTQQSDHNLPRTHFTQGIVNHCKTTASEQQGIALLFNIILCSTWAIEKKSLSFRLSTERTGNFIRIIELLLCLEELLKCHSGKTESLITRENLPKIVLYTQVLLTTIKANAGRLVGDGFNVVKFHLLNHMLIEDIPKYGSPANVSGGPGESQFKENFKNPGESTQLNDVTFVEQVCMRKYQHHTASRCANRVARMEDSETKGLFDGKPYLLNPLHEGFITETPETQEHFGSVLRKTGTFLEKTANGEDQNSPDTGGNTAAGLSARHYVVFTRSPTCARVSQDLNEGGSGLTPNRTAMKKKKKTTRHQSDVKPWDVVYTGKKQSSRYNLFTETGSMLSPPILDIDNDRVGAKGCPSLRDHNDGFQTIVDLLESIFHKANYKKHISLYTVYRVKPERYQDLCTLYRADPCCYLGLKERYDWALFQTKLGERVGQILSFIKMDSEMIDLYNEHKPKHLGLLDNVPGDYALVQLLARSMPGLTDPSIIKPNEKDLMQVNSTLVFYGKKQLQKDKRPITRLLPVRQIKRPLVVLPDVSPKFSSSASGCRILEMNINKENKRKHAYMILRPRDLWHKVFIHKAIDHYRSLGPNGEEAFRRKCEAEAEAEAAAEEIEVEKKKEAAAAKRKATAAAKKQAAAETKAAAAAKKQAAAETKATAAAKKRAAAEQSNDAAEISNTPHGKEKRIYKPRAVAKAKQSAKATSRVSRTKPPKKK